MDVSLKTGRFDSVLKLILTNEDPVKLDGYIL